MHKTPKTIGDILKHFEGLTFHGIDLSLALSDQFSTEHALESIHVRQKNDWVYLFLRHKPFSYYFFRKWRTSDQINLKPVNCILLATGVDRFASLSFPILEKLFPISSLVVYTGSYATKLEPSVPTIQLKNIPFDFAEMQQGISSFWRELQKRLTKLQKEFGFSNSKVYSIMSVLCMSIATVLRAELLLSTTRPSVIFTEFDRQHHDAIILQVARKMAIPTITLVHGLQGGKSFAKSLWAPLVADKIIVWGKWMRDNFVKMGVSPDQIEIGGYTRLNKISYNDKQSVSKKLTSTNIPIDKPVILMISSSLSPEKRAIEIFMSAEVDLPDYTFMIRPHPQENLKWYFEHFPAKMHRIQDPHTWTLNESLASTNIIVGSASSACIDALILGKKVILLPDKFINYWEIPMLLDGVQRGEIYVANDHNELVALLSSLGKRLEHISGFALECAEVIGSDAAELTANILKRIALHVNRD